MSSRAVAIAETASATARVGQMGLVVGAVEVLAIPAGREDDGGADTTGARLRGEGPSVLAVTRSKALAVSVAAMAHIGVGLCSRAEVGVACNHAEAGLEGSDLVLLGVRIHVVNRKTTVLRDTDVGHLGNSLVGSVLRRLEVDVRSPVVAVILGERACSAGGGLGWVHVGRVHLGSVSFDHLAGRGGVEP